MSSDIQKEPFDVRMAVINAKIQELFQSEEDVAQFAITMLNWVDDVSTALGRDLKAIQAHINSLEHTAPGNVQ